MFVLEDFGLYLIYLLFFIGSYFTFEKIMSFKQVIRISRPKSFDEILGGLFIGLFTLISKLIILKIDDSFSSPLFVSTALLVLVFKNYLRSLFSIIIPALLFAIDNYEGEVVYMTMIALFATIVAVVSIKQFFSVEFAQFLNIITFVIIYNVTFAVGTLNILLYDYIKVLRSISLIYIYLVAGYILTNIWMIFTLNSKILYEQSRLAFLDYLRPSIFVETINRYIFKHKINYGALVLFQLDIDKNDSYYQAIDENIDVEHIAYEIISKNAGDKSVLFNIMENKNGLFIPIDKIDLNSKWKMSERDKIFIDFILNSATKQYVWREDKEPITIKVQAGISIYGIDNSSLSELIDYSSFALNEQPEAEVIRMFNSKAYLTSLRNNETFKNMDKALHLDSYANVAYPIFDVNSFKYWGEFNKVENVSEYQFFETIDESIFFQNWQNMFNRFQASNALKNSKESKNVFFDYSPTIFEDRKFSVKAFKLFLIRNNINPKLVIIIFKKISIPKIRDFTKVLKHIGELKAFGIRVAFYGLDDLLFNSLDLTPDFIIIDNKDIKSKNIAKYNDIPIINPFIGSEQQFVDSYSKGVHLLAGNLIKGEINFRKLDKKSRIYIDILKKRGRGNGDKF